MQHTEHIMGMPIHITIVEDKPAAVQAAFDYFRAIDEQFSTYKPASEISRLNDGLEPSKWSDGMKRILDLCEQTKRETNGYFDIRRHGKLDPSGLVKGWAINNAAELMRAGGAKNFYIEAGGDIQPHGHNAEDAAWRFGIRNPFNHHQTIKTIAVTTEGVATSGTYSRGQHIYNPLHPTSPITDIVSLTVIGPNIYEADRFATAGFAMGAPGINFIDSLPGFEAYMIGKNGVATLTQGFERYVA